MYNYWEPRIGKDYTLAQMERALCIDDDLLYLQSEPGFHDTFSGMRILTEYCIHDYSDEVECAD